MMFWWVVYVVLFCIVAGLIWREAKQADDRFERDSTIGVDQIRGERMAQIRRQQGIDPPARIHALREDR